MNKNDTYINNDFDFTPFGDAIKKGRKRAGLTVEQLAERTGVSARYISAIENEGKRTSVKTLFDIMTFLHISVDEILYPFTSNKNSQRRYIDEMLDQLDDNSLEITEALLEKLVEINTKENSENE